MLRHKLRWVLAGLAGLLVALAGLTAAPPAGEAQNVLERLVMPGDLIEGHAKLEKDCNNCHKPFSKESQSRLCADCHKEVKRDIAEKRGFHGKKADAAGSECRHCHADHKGRGADIVQLDRETFDHAATSFPLAGRHAGARCDACHATGKKYRAAPSACVECHRNGDVHRGKAGNACGLCHGEESWKALKRYDHDRTSYPLTGGHRDVACKSCHAGERFKGLTTVCADCHREKDKHNGRLGAKCQTCHSTKSWSEVRFDHDKDTKFPLAGKHQPAACVACHKPPPAPQKLETGCKSCHAKEDEHKGELGANCHTCHNASGWKIGVLFDHDKARFPLKGKHADVKCGDCHKTKLYRDTPRTCIGCHKKQDGESHQGRFGPACEKCHGETTWKKATFDHGKTGFALTGRHAGVSCYACHKQKDVQRATLPKDCYSCHQAQDRHRGAFGRDCAKCHTTQNFTTAFIRR